MSNEEYLFFIDDDLDENVREPFVLELFNKLKNKCNGSVLAFSKMRDVLEKGMELTNKVQYCVLDPRLQNKGTSFEDFSEITLLNIQSILDNINSEMKLIILTSRIPTDGERLKQKIKNKYSNYIGFFYKYDFIKEKFLIDELSDKILELLEDD